MDQPNPSYCEGGEFRRLPCLRIELADGMDLEYHLFLVSQLPCCAQIALPFWAKITGRIRNDRTEDALLKITVRLLDNDGLPLADYTDVMALDGEQNGDFEVRLIEHEDLAKDYTLTVEEVELL